MKTLHVFCICLLLLLTMACSQRTEAPPTNRDGVSGGQPQPDQRPTPPGPGPSEPGYLPPGERTQLGEEQYTVVVGSFDRSEDADQLAFELRMHRIGNFVDRAGGKWHVCVGQYATRGRALRTLDVLYQKGFTNSRVVGPGLHP